MRDRSRPSLAEIFREHGKFVWRALRYLGVREADLDDVCQEVFLIAHRKLPQFEGRSSVRTWLYGIAVRCASTHRRRAHVRREEPTESLPDQGHAPDQGSRVERAQSRARLRDALDQLDEDKRAVLVLYEIEELSMKEVAEAVGCPLQTAYSRLHKARELVAKRMRQAEVRSP
jgi:RNA polymerase sigma-70 factor (ECF subfamily)